MSSISSLLEIENNTNIIQQIQSLNIFQTPRYLLTFAHNIILTAILRPLSIEKLATIISTLSPPKELKEILLQKLLTYLIRRSYKPRSPALG